MQRCSDVFHCYLVLADGCSADPAAVDKILAEQAERTHWGAPTFIEQTGPTRHFLCADMRMRATCAAPDDRPELQMAISAEGNTSDVDLQIRLAALVYALLDVLEVTELRWLDGPQPISPDQFRTLLAPTPQTDATVSARRPAMPHLRRRARPAALLSAPVRAQMAGVATATRPRLSRQETLLRDALRLELSPAALLQEFGPQSDSDPLRLSAWLLTFVVALFALPVAICLAAANLMRGESFRLATHILVLAALFSIPQVAATLSLSGPQSAWAQIIVALEQAVPLLTRIT